MLDCSPLTEPSRLKGMETPYASYTAWIFSFSSLTEPSRLKGMETAF